MSLESTPLAIDFDPLKTSSVVGHQLGTEIRVADGRVFRYAKAGASAISRGKLQLAPAPKANHHNIAVAAAAALGATSVTVTLGATAAVANEYAEGYLIVSDAAGEGTAYKINNHPAADASAALTITLQDPIANVALTTASEVTLVHNSYNNVVEGTSQTQKPAGIPLVNIAAGAFGWLQVKGVAPALADETLTVGTRLAAGTSTAGAVEEIADVTAPLTEFEVGYAIVAGVDTEYRPVYLNIV